MTSQEEETAPLVLSTVRASLYSFQRTVRRVIEVALFEALTRINAELSE